MKIATLILPLLLAGCTDAGCGLTAIFGNDAQKEACEGNYTVTIYSVPTYIPGRDNP
jgi:hypothetical protein